MKKFIMWAVPILILLLGLSGCNLVNEKTASLSIIYGAASIVSLFLLIGCLMLVRRKRHWFILLFSSVLVVNIGYTLLSVSPNLILALWANRISYLGSVFLPLSMLMIILSVTNTQYKLWLPPALIGIAILVFLVAASPGILNIYYKEVSLTVIDGVSTLVKEYGPLHSMYLIYLVGYFATMVFIIIRASVKKTIDTTSHAIIIAIVVFVNIGVWFIGQLTSIDFEFLSISYIISESFLMGVHLVIKENQRLKDLIAEKDKALMASKVNKSPLTLGEISDSTKEHFKRGLEILTPTELTIYDAYLVGTSTKEVMNTLGIKENTLKFHNKNIYSKLGVSSRKQLLEIYRIIKLEQQN